MGTVKFISPWGVGDVVLYEGNELVILQERNNEDMGSCAYDREYKVCKRSEIEKIMTLNSNEFDKLGYWITIRGVSNFPNYTKIDTPPFEIAKEVIYKIREKTPVSKIEYI